MKNILSARPVLAMWLVAAAPAAAQEGESLFGIRSASVTFGPYVRAEAGASAIGLDNGQWTGPGASDPRIDFGLAGQDVGFGAVAVGYDWQDGLRADISVFGTGSSGVVATCESASDGSSCATHVSGVDLSVKTRGLMANVFYAPLEARGSNSVFQPFVVAGVGVALNDVSEWTRTNPASSRPVRSFEGNTSSDFAWSIGVGASLQISEPGRWPVILEAAWRYYDYGTPSGGRSPLPGNGASEPREPISFRHTGQVVTLGLRIPLQRY